MASKAWLSAGKFQVAGIPGLHWSTAEACLRPDASVSRVCARLTAASDLGSIAGDRLAGERQPGLLFEPDRRSQLGCPFREPLLKQPGAVGKLMKTVVDLAQPRSQPGTRRAAAGCPAAGSPSALRSAGAGATAAG